MCLDNEMIVMFFLVFVIAPITFVAGIIYIVIKAVKSGKLK